jgi:hypothetical protein
MKAMTLEQARRISELASNLCMPDPLPVAEVVESSSDAAWAEWDAAVQARDGVAS